MRQRHTRVAVRHPNDPNRPWVIPADHYDPAVHELWDEAPRPKPKRRRKPRVRHVLDVESVPEAVPEDA